MIKNEQEILYKKVGHYLQVAREHKRLTRSQLADKAGEQFNTIRAIEEGKPFYFHRAVWITKVLSVDINKMLTEIMEGNYGKRRSTIEDYI